MGGDEVSHIHARIIHTTIEYVPVSYAHVPSIRAWTALCKQWLLEQLWRAMGESQDARRASRGSDRMMLIRMYSTVAALIGNPGPGPSIPSGECHKQGKAANKLLGLR